MTNINLAILIADQLRESMRNSTWCDDYSEAYTELWNYYRDDIIQEIRQMLDKYTTK